MSVRLFFLLLALAVGSNGFELRMSRRQCGGMVASAVALPVHAAEPIPIPTLTPEQEAERLARKMEALRKQDRRGKADAKIMFGSDFQAGKREMTQDKGGFKMPVLLPNDVGGINLMPSPMTSK